MERWNTSIGRDSSQGPFLPKLGSAKANLGTTSPSPFKKTQSYIANKYVIPSVGSTPMNRTNGNLPIHGLAGDMFKNNTG